jgi:surface carbohydrate biosynthesis protein
MKISSIPAAFKYVWRSSKVWTKPKHSKILIYDRQGAEDLCEYLRMNTVEIFDCRGETINIMVLLSALLKYGLKINMRTYSECYVAIVAPTVVITFIDNTKTFYQLKRNNPSIKVVSIQNGNRDNCLFDILSDNLTSNEFLEADAVLCFGSAIGSLYSKYINTKIYPIGSFKNNKVLKKIKINKTKSVLFLSQFRTPVWYKGEPTMPVGSRHILWDEFYSVEQILLPYLLKYSQLYDFEFKVCGTSFNKDGAEQAYFSSLLGSSGWEYLSKDGNLSNYQRVDEVECIAFIDSTLGYEALGRGVKAAAFPLRGKALNAEDRRFGWPANVDNTGPFWTNSTDESEVERLIKFITTVSDEVWMQTCFPIVSQLMEYDAGNKQFVNLIESFGVPL